MTPATVAVHGRAAAGAAGDDGGHPDRRRLGDRHRDAVDADRPDQPRQLHLCGIADAELGVRAVRLPCRRGAGAGGGPVAGADRERPAQPQPAAHGTGRHRHRRAGRWPRWCRRWRARRRPIWSAQRPLPSSMCCRPDGAAAARGRTFRRSAKASAPMSCSMRWRLAISTSMSTIPARCGRTSFTAPTSSRAPNCSAELKTILAEQEHHLARRARFRECLCAGDAAQARGRARHQDHRRPRRQGADDVDRRRLRVLLAAGMGRHSEGLWAFLPHPADDAAGFHVCGGCLRRGRRHRRLYQRRADREIRSGHARRSQARDPAL